MKLFNRKPPQQKKDSQKKLHMESFPEIERKMVLQGKYIPGVINNGGHYFFTNLEVFEDGLIDCWEMVDLDIFRNKLDYGWVATRIPEGQKLSIHNLGSWTVKSGHWNFDKQSYFRHITNVIKSMNPEMRNLYNCYGKTTKTINGVNVSVLGLASGTPVRKEDPADYFSTTHKGDSFRAFLKTKDRVYQLANIQVFADSKIQLAGIETPKLISIEEFTLLVSEKKICSQIPEDSSVSIYGLGKCTFGACQYAIDIDDKVDELVDMIAQLNGKKTTSVICREIYEQYIENPTVVLRDSLRKAYESIPKHLRIYVLGDMDTKDIPVRMIIYGDQEIENWSHYIISKEQGYELPQLNVPKPKDENNIN